MLKRKALNKIFITTITLFILLTIYMIPSIHKEEVLKTNLELEYVSGVGTNTIYLLDNNNYLVKSKILLTSKDLSKNIRVIINNLTIGESSSHPNGLKGTIPEGTKLLDISIDNKIATLNFNKKILSVDKDLEDRMFESIVYSIIDLGNIDGIKIKIEGEYLGNYPNSKVKLPEILDKSIGINKEYDINTRKDINKVVIYFLEDIDGVNYYVPVTKYLNDSRDKVKIIIDKLTTSYIYEPNLMSLLNKDVKLNSYNEEENVMFIDFNNSIFNSKEKIEEEVIYSLSYSIFDNYNVKSVVYTVNDKALKTVEKSAIY